MAAKLETMPEVAEELRAPNIDVSDEDLEKYLESLDELCLLEASTLKRSVDSSLQQWQLCHQALEEIGKNDKLDPQNRTIIQSNVLQSVNVDELDSFEEDYEKNVDRLNRISNKLLQIIDEHKDEADSTRFMTTEMVTILGKKLASLDPSMLNYEFERKTAEMILSTFEDRLTGSFDNRLFLFNRFQSYIDAHRKEISKSFRQEAKAIGSNQKTRAIKDLCNQFSDNTVAKFIDRLTDAFHDRVDIVVLFTNFLARQLANGKKNGTDSQAKLLVFDLLDMYNGTYDIENMSESEYLDDLWESSGEYADMYLRTAKLALKDGKRTVTESTFGLVLPKFADMPIIRDQDTNEVESIDDLNYESEDESPEEVDDPETDKESEVDSPIEDGDEE